MDTQESVCDERRSRLTPEREAEVFRAVVDLMRDVGYDAMTMDAVAARAKCSKATLYRQWPGKPRLVITAIRSLQPVTIPRADTGSLVGDLYAVAAHLASLAPRMSTLMASVAHAATSNEDLAETLREVVIDPERAAYQEIVERAVARGELPHYPAAADLTVPLLIHEVVLRPVCDRAQATEEHLRNVVDLVILPALKHSGPAIHDASANAGSRQAS